MHIWKKNQVHVECKKILACGGGDVFHVKPLLGEGVKVLFFFFFFFQTERGTSFEKEINI